MPYLLLILAIVGEVIGSAFLKSSEGFLSFFQLWQQLFHFLHAFIFKQNFTIFTIKYYIC